MKNRHPRRTREQLAALAARRATREGRPGAGVRVVRFSHDNDCPLLAGRAYCQCAVEVLFREVPRS